MVNKAILKEIAEQIDCGFDCYLNIKTNEIISIPNEDNMMEIESTEWKNEIKKIKKDKKLYIMVSPMSSRESFKIMEDFAESVAGEELRDRLLTSLVRPKPFWNFKFELERSPELRKAWFEFKENETIKWVRNEIQFNLNSED
jgi:hypothetical protein